MHAVMETEANRKIGQYARRLRCINHDIKLNKYINYLAQIFMINIHIDK